MRKSAALFTIVLLFLASCATGPETSGPEKSGPEKEEAGETSEKSAENPAEESSGGGGVSVWSDPVDVANSGRSDPAPINENRRPAPPAEGEEEDESGEWLVAPIPFSNPTLGSGLGVFAGYIFPIDPEDKVSPNSTVGVGGFYSSNGSWGAFGGGNGYLFEDTWRFRGGVAFVSLNLDFYGIGHGAGEDGQRIRLNQESYGALIEVTRLIGWDSYLGPRAQAWWVETTFVDDALADLLPEDWLSERIVSLGLQFQRDTRDDVRYPHDGGLVEITFDSFKETWGSDEDYDILETAFNHYFGLAEESVLAARLYGRFSFGDTPYYGLSQMGKKSDLRGYNAGQYRDKMLLAGQVEFRHFFSDRFGAVAFAGAGAVAPEIDEWESDEILPSVGAGLRYVLAPENRVNFRIDVAWGAEGWALYFGVGEAF